LFAEDSFIIMHASNEVLPVFNFFQIIVF